MPDRRMMTEAEIRQVGADVLQLTGDDAHLLSVKIEPNKVVIYRGKFGGGITIHITDDDKKLSAESFTDRYLRPAFGLLT